VTYACSEWEASACNLSTGNEFTYTYDGAGNLTRFDKWNGSAVETIYYLYNGANQIKCVDHNNNGSCQGESEALYQYDAYGNLTDDGTSTYTYDAANRLVSVTAGSDVTSYSYDGDGNRLSQTVNGTLTTYVLDIATPLTMVLSETSNGQTIHYWQGLDTLAQSDGTTPQYFQYDGLGSVRQLANSSGAVQLAQTFDPYGNPYAKAGSSTTGLGFSGEQTDSNGFVFLRARYYNPSAGRFLNTDPSRQEQNPYLYSMGNPVMFTDPSGLDGLVSLPIVGDEVSGMVQWQDDWYGYKKHSFGGLQCNAQCRRSIAASLAQYWAYKKPGILPWGNTGYFNDHLAPDEATCNDCIRFVSYILWRAGFRMYGSDYQNGEPVNFDGSGQAHFPNQDTDKNEWGAASVAMAGAYTSSAFETVQYFYDQWSKNGRAKPITEQDTCRSVAACEDSKSPLRSLDTGDVVLYDYAVGEHEWNHAAMVVQKLTDTTPLTVASRGGRTYIPPGPNTSGGWECGTNTTPVGGFLNVTGTNSFDNGGIVKIGALHINYEQYLP
jgi:RHS repeat-associated protein